MNVFLRITLARAIKTGRLEIVDSSGATHRFGDGGGNLVRIRFRSAKAERALLLDPEMKLGEEYTDGGYEIEAGSVLDFLTLLRSMSASAHELGGGALPRFTNGRIRACSWPSVPWRSFTRQQQMIDHAIRMNQNRRQAQMGLTIRSLATPPRAGKRTIDAARSDGMEIAETTAG